MRERESDRKRKSVCVKEREREKKRERERERNVFEEYLLKVTLVQKKQRTKTIQLVQNVILFVHSNKSYMCV